MITNRTVRDSKPVCTGTGLIGLDVLIDDKHRLNAQFWTGGSCGNVLAILAYFGWKAYPIANLGRDWASEAIMKDIEKWDVMTDFMLRDKFHSTPIIIHRLLNRNNGATHQFEFVCPNCGARLPRNKPVPLQFAEETIKKTPASQVYYFDRVSRASLELAKHQRAQGALIVFEPSRHSDQDLFQECVGVSHIVKYSAEQIREKGISKDIPLEIQTLGSSGLRYRFNNGSIHDWKIIPSYNLSNIIDSAGAGDWCTAGLIHELGRSGARSFENASIKRIEDALKFGEALAALSCLSLGARGLMYAMSLDRLERILTRFINGKGNSNWVEFRPRGAENQPSFSCDKCQ